MSACSSKNKGDVLPYAFCAIKVLWESAKGIISVVIKRKTTTLVAFLFSSFSERVGNGEDTKFWEDTWFNDIALKVQFPRVYALESQKDISVADKKKDTTLALSFRRSPRRGAEDEQFQLLLSCVYDILLPQCAIVGCGLWFLRVVPIKLNIMASRVCNLSSKGSEIPSLSCPLCDVSILSRETLSDVRSAYATISNEESHRVAVGSIVGSSQRNQTSAFVSNVPYSQNF
ncbi:hypothetical protein Tco_0625472 [Tanacetum coccineum]|uniref:Uncharacterized protein n=1 Tax=Tanacetum coccineum TaxID=301880 RepID=A0ABQ4WGV2_9ASTR